MRMERARKVEVLMPGEWIGEQRNGTRPQETREIDLCCGDATEAQLGTGEFDAVFTDPPYFGNVQYAELMDFCFVWLRKLAGLPHGEFDGLSTRHANELTGNVSMGRDLAHFTEGLGQPSASRLGPLRPTPACLHLPSQSTRCLHARGRGDPDANLVCSG